MKVKKGYTHNIYFCNSQYYLRDDSSVESCALNADFVGASPDPEETFLSPGRSPGVLHDPELLLSDGFNSVANEQHGVVYNLRMNVYFLTNDIKQKLYNL